MTLRELNKIFATRFRRWADARKFLSNLGAPDAETRRHKPRLKSFDVNRHLMPALAGSGCRLKPIGTDASSMIATAADWEKIIVENKVDRKRYRAGDYDCENFALEFVSAVIRDYGVGGVGIAIDYSGGHGYVVIFHRDGSGIKCRPFEPQTDRWVRFGSGNYKAEKGWLILF